MGILKQDDIIAWWVVGEVGKPENNMIYCINCHKGTAEDEPLTTEAFTNYLLSGDIVICDDCGTRIF